jgi:hypothetical protein
MSPNADRHPALMPCGAHQTDHGGKAVKAMPVKGALSAFGDNHRLVMEGV